MFPKILSWYFTYPVLLMETFSWAVTLEIYIYICFKSLTHGKRKSGNRLKVFDKICFSVLLGNGILITIIMGIVFAYGFINLPTIAFIMYPLAVLIITFINFLILAFLKSERYKGAITYKLAHSFFII